MEQMYLYKKKREVRTIYYNLSKEPLDRRPHVMLIDKLENKVIWRMMLHQLCRQHHTCTLSLKCELVVTKHLLTPLECQTKHFEDLSLDGLVKEFKRLSEIRESKRSVQTPKTSFVVIQTYLAQSIIKELFLMDMKLSMSKMYDGNGFQGPVSNI